ncbi:hypothetical protein EDD22DRAFT_947949 [Suillus occidentalis]|nr:hypothetical protein EDD22DRAFT_947949 [Suillus occidentalis]
MSSEDNPTQGVRNAKKKALNNAVWLPEKTRTKRQKHDKASSQCDVAQGELQRGSQPQSKPKPMRKQRYLDVSPVAEEDEAATNRWSPDMPSPQQEPQWGSQPRSKPKPTKKHHRTSPVESEDEAKAVKHKCPRLNTKLSSRRLTTHKLKSIKEDQLVDETESEEADDHTNSDRTDFDGTDFSDFEDIKSIANTLSTEIPSFVLSAKAKKPAAVNKQSARARKRATETPMWADDLIVSESEELCDSDEPAPKSDTSTFINASTLHANTVKVKSEEYSSDSEHKSDASTTVGSESSSHHSRSSSPKLVITNNRKVKMTDQDVPT